jgi:pimeloyl-ACP methyl ester carboxylesterase
MADLQGRLVADVSTDEAPANNVGYQGKAVTSGAHVYRLMFRTERGDSASSPGYQSAKLFIPDTPRSAGPLPIVVGARGSRGQAAACAASKEDPSVPGINGDYRALAYAMVGAGFAIIVPDLAGYANYGAAGNPISGYAEAVDVGKGTLDGARALAKLYPSAFNGKVAIVGHSQGGHSALASLALAPTYAPELNIAAVATYSPLWISQRTWGALLFLAGSYPLATSPSTNAVSVWYHYTHGELLDGPGHGVDVFAADKQAGIKAWVDSTCWGNWSGLQALGTSATDLFDAAFVASIKTKAIKNGDPATACAGTGADGGVEVDPVCQKWMQRYDDDRPHLSGTTPLLIEYGAEDQTIPPERMACVTDRLKKQDNVPYSFCLNPGVGHSGVVRLTGSYVADWVGSKTLGEPDPGPCAETDANLVDDAGTQIKCATPPSNQ